MARLTLAGIDAMTAHLPAGEQRDARIRLACELIRRELRALRRRSVLPTTDDEQDYG